MEQNKYSRVLILSWEKLSIRNLEYLDIPICILADSGFFKNFLYQGGMKQGGARPCMKPTVFGVFQDVLKFKISEGYDQNWCFPDCAQLAVSV